MSNLLQTIKIVVVGDGAVGKTSLALTYVTDTFPGEYIPSVAEGCEKHRLVDQKPFYLRILDTPAQDDYDRLRPTCYPDTDVFFICFSVVEPTSLESVTKKWYPEVKEHCPNTPIFLVGTKLDLRTDEKCLERLKSREKSPVATSQGVEMKDTIGACRYIECSSLTRENLATLFDEVIVVSAKRKSTKCVIL